jgi:hypothetical protein
MAILFTTWGTETMNGTSLGVSAALTGALDGPRIAPIRLVVETLTADSITETAIISMGFNSPDYDDMVRGHAVNPVAGAVDVVQLPPRPVVGTGSLHARVTRAASGIALTFRALLEGMNSQ